MLKSLQQLVSDRRSVLLPGAAGVFLLLFIVWVSAIDPDQPADSVLFLGRFHPLLVHLPIGFIMLAILMEVLIRWPRFGYLKDATLFVWVVGAASAIGAAVAGYLLSFSGGYDEVVLNRHIVSGIALIVLSLAACGIRYLGYEKALTPVIALTAITLFGSSHLGASITHGTDYLTYYMPQPLRTIAGMPPREGRRVIENIDEAIVFDDIIRPIFQDRCLSCHGSSKRESDLRLDSPQHILRGGEGGLVLVAGNSNESDMVRRIMLSRHDDDVMPPSGRRPLTAEQIALITWWVDEGAPFDSRVAEHTVPEVIQEIFVTLTGGASSKMSAVYSMSVPEAAPRALEAIRSEGISVVQLANDQPFLQVHSTNVAGRFEDDALRLLLPIAQQITWLNLARTRITDSGLSVVAQLPHLTRLHLELTAVTDAGLASLQSLQYLEYLNLYGTAVTDEGLEHLAALPELKSLYLWQTDVTEEGVERLKERLPQLEVNLGWEAPSIEDEGPRVEAAGY